MSGPAAPATGWRDAHLHLGAYGEALEAVDLSGCASSTGALERLAERAETLGPDAWITAIGARVEGWRDRRWPRHDEIDAAAGGRPAIVRSFDLHSGAVSSRVLGMLGIGRGFSDPPGGRIEREPSGEPTGLFIETAWRLVDAVIPPVTHERRVERVRLACADLALRGFTEVHDLWTDLALARAIRELERAGELALRVGLAPVYAEMRACLSDEAFSPSDRVWVAGVKIFADGTINSRTAHMLGPYADPDPSHPCGVAILSGAAIEGAVRDADAAGLPILAHAIGDAAVRSVLDAIERAGPRTRGQRIEHAQFVDEADAPRFAKLGVIASMQPCHLLADVEAIERLLPHRAHRAFPVRDLVDAARSAGREPAELVWFGSDAPVVSPSVGDNLQAAVRRRRADSGAIAPEQAIGEAEAAALSATPARS